MDVNTLNISLDIVLEYELFSSQGSVQPIFKPSFMFNSINKELKFNRLGGTKIHVDMRQTHCQ